MNNRQNGRRRGRGNGQPPRNGQSGGPDRGNRIDNRARGNASQLYEKYKALARDAQMQGDRVNIEYYLQFADHYFRVLNENRVRFEEQRPRRDEYADGDAGRDGFDEGDGEEGFDDGVASRSSERQPERMRDQPREERRPRPSRDGQSRDGQTRDAQFREGQAHEGQPRDGQSRDGQRRDGRERAREQAPDAMIASLDTPSPVPEGASVEVAVPQAEERRPRRRARAVSAEPAVANDAVGQGRLEIDRLPPAFAPEVPSDPIVPANDAAIEADEKPRRRTRRPRGEATAAADA